MPDLRYKDQRMLIEEIQYWGRLLVEAAGNPITLVPDSNTIYAKEVRKYAGLKHNDDIQTTSSTK